MRPKARSKCCVPLDCCKRRLCDISTTTRNDLEVVISESDCSRIRQVANRSDWTTQRWYQDRPHHLQWSSSRQVPPRSHHLKFWNCVHSKSPLEDSVGEIISYVESRASALLFMALAFTFKITISCIVFLIAANVVCVTFPQPLAMISRLSFRKAIAAESGGLPTEVTEPLNVHTKTVLTTCNGLLLDNVLRDLSTCSLETASTKAAQSLPWKTLWGEPFPMSNHEQVRSCSWRWPSLSRSRFPASSSAHASHTCIPEWGLDSPLSWLELGASELFGSFVTSCRNYGIHLETMAVRMNNSQETLRIRLHLSFAMSIRLHERANVHVIIVLHLPTRWRQCVSRFFVELLLLPLHTYGFLMHWADGGTPAPQARDFPLMLIWSPPSKCLSPESLLNLSWRHPRSSQRANAGLSVSNTHRPPSSGSWIVLYCEPPACFETSSSRATHPDVHRLVGHELREQRVNFTAVSYTVCVWSSPALNASYASSSLTVSSRSAVQSRRASEWRWTAATGFSNLRNHSGHSWTVNFGSVPSPRLFTDVRCADGLSSTVIILGNGWSASATRVAPVPSATCLSHNAVSSSKTLTSADVAVPKSRIAQKEPPGHSECVGTNNRASHQIRNWVPYHNRFTSISTLARLPWCAEM